jgi:Phosphotransferase enzyme family
VVDRVPADEGLPQLRRLLDPDAMRSVLARSLPPRSSVSEVRIRYLRYKPATRLVVRYGVTLGDGAYDATALAEPSADLAGWARDRRHLALARKVDGRAPALTPLAYDTELGALIQWLPLDLTMPGLAEEPAELRSLLQAAGVEIAASSDGPETLAYKARRRAVLRLDDHVVKIYAGTADFENALVGLEASGRLRELVVPASEGVLPALQLTCQTLLAGKTPRGHHGAARAAGSALALLHRAPFEGLRSFPPEGQLAAAASSARSAAAVAPEVASRLEKLMRELELALPDGSELVATHGDFHANQVLELDGGLAVIDFDEVCAAPAALDFSSYVAHLVNGAPGELEAAAVALDDLVAGYGTRPAGLLWYVATSIVRRVPFPFRFMDEDWPARVEQMVADAEEALRL